jgi:alpha-glucosidase
MGRARTHGPAGLRRAGFARPRGGHRAARRSWWQDGVLYQVYPRSFADADGDGHGDLRGIRARLDHLVRLGVAGIWLNPTCPSPNADWGYDVAGYCDVHPDFGTLADMDALIADAHAAGIRVLLDLVPNHTSDRHPWFAESRSSRDNPKADWYVWADPRPDGSPPNNWVSMFGGPAWEWEPRRAQFYLRNFTREQPDLNWWCEGVRAEFDRILRFWLNRGVDGFRIDVCQAIVKDRALRDNPPTTPGDRANVRLRGQRPELSMNRPEVHDVLRRWRAICDGYAHKPILLGETNTHDLGALAGYYGEGDELHMAFNVPFMGTPFQAAALREVIERTEATLPPHAQPVWTISNHDAPRFVTRWCDGDERIARAALVLLGDVPVSAGTRAGRTVADQEADPGSILHLTRALIALRAAEPDLRRAPMRFGDAPDGVLVLERGALRVTLNLTDRAQRRPAGKLVLATAPVLGGAIPARAAAITRRAGV